MGQDWTCFQRFQARSRCCCQQACWWQDPAQEDLRARGAREAQPVQEGLLGQSARQRGEEDRGQDHWKEGCSMQKAAKEAHLVSTKDNEPQVLGPIPFEFMA